MYYNTWQPDFEGFYNTDFEFDLDEWTLFNNPDAVNEDHLTWLIENLDDHVDYTAYHNAVSKLYMESWFEMANFDFVKNVKFEKVNFPKEYNFATDAIDISINLNLKKLLTAFKSHPNFKTYIQENYKSCDGFISWYSNDPETWVNDIREESEHKIGAMLQCLGYEIVDHEEIRQKIYEEILFFDYLNYTELIDGFNEKFETEIKSLDELEDFDKPKQTLLSL